MLLGSNLVQKFRHDLEIMLALSEGALSLNSSETRGAVELPCQAGHSGSLRVLYTQPPSGESSSSVYHHLQLYSSHLTLEFLPQKHEGHLGIAS